MELCESRLFSLITFGEWILIKLSYHEFLDCNCQTEVTRFEVLRTLLLRAQIFWDIYCKVCVKCGVADPHLMLTTMCEFRENERRECRIFVVGVCVRPQPCAV